MDKEKIVNIRWTIDLPMKFPENWDDELIEFHLNKSGWCADNLITELENYSDKNGCICDICKAKVNNQKE